MKNTPGRIFHLVDRRLRPPSLLTHSGLAACQQGRILHDTFIYPHPPTKSFLIDYPTPSVLSPPLRDHLRKFVLRSKVGIKDVSDQYDVWAAWGHPDELELELGGKRKWKFGNGETAELNWEPEPLRWEVSEGEVGGWDSRAPGMGWRGLVAKGDKREFCASLQILIMLVRCQIWVLRR